MSSRITFPSSLVLALLLPACGGGDSGDAYAGRQPTEATLAAASYVDPDFIESATDTDADSDTHAGTASQDNRYLAGSTVVGASPSNYKAMWSWRDRDIYNATEQQKLLNFAVANKITSIYVSAEWLMRDYPQQFAAFINAAASRNITVELLLANHEWALTANHQQAIDQVRKANAFVRNLTGAKPVGLHFDVEPHSLPGWETNKVSYGNQVIDLYAKVNKVKDPSLSVNADMAMSYRTINIVRNGITKTLQKWVIDSTDHTTLMAYRDYALGADSITYHANTPVTYAGRRGKVTYVGVETTCNLAPEKITFCEEKRAGLNTELSHVVAEYAGARGFGGLVVHDYAGYSILP
ncbi:hypothetical protein GCM10027343_14580 [Noviherbaspirillum agri]